MALIGAFSRHAKLLSPHHGPTSYRFDPSHWFAILDYGFKAEVAAAFEKTHPEHHHAVAWHTQCKSKLEPDAQPAPVLMFPVYFCLLTRNPSAHRTADGRVYVMEREHPGLGRVAAG